MKHTIICPALSASLTVPLLLACGCHGPLVAPAIRRVDAQEQARVDLAWENLTSDITEVDRTLLLDTLIMSNLYQHGIDRLDLVSTKKTADGLVTMEIHFDREQPERDAFTFAYVNSRTGATRVETFASSEVWERTDFFMPHYSSVRYSVAQQEYAGDASGDAEPAEADAGDAGADESLVDADGRPAGAGHRPDAGDESQESEAARLEAELHLRAVEERIAEIQALLFPEGLPED